MSETEPADLPASVLDERPGDFVLGAPAPTLLLADAADNLRATVAFARQCRRLYRIFSRALDPGVLDHPEFLDAIRLFALRSQHSRVQILLLDSEKVIKRGHRLVELARSLSSYFDIRRPAEQYRDAADAFIVADESGVIYRKHGDRYEGTADFHAQRDARDLIGRFDEIWQQSHTDPEMRGLYV